MYIRHKNSVNSKKIRIKVIEFKKLDTLVLDWDLCQICSSKEDETPRLITWEYPPYGFTHDNITSIVNLGKCDWCQGYHIKCDVCGSITPIHEEDLNKDIECMGGCGLFFNIKREDNRDNLFKDELTIKIIQN